MHHMHLVFRARGRAITVGAGIVAAVLAMSLAADSAHAADPTYHSIVQNEGTQNYALKAWPSGSITRTIMDGQVGGVPSSQRWIRTEHGSNYFSFESVKYPGQCLEVRSNISGDALMTGRCETFLARQRWTPGFLGGVFRKLHNQDSGYVASYKLPSSSGQPSVTQAIDQGLAGQKWQVMQTFRGPYAQ